MAIIYYILRTTHIGLIAFFKPLEAFEKLRTVADRCRLMRPDSYDFTYALSILEEHDAIKDVLNRGHSHFNSEVFSPIHKSFFEFINKFLQENETPVATGGVNEWEDLVAIRNLAQEYDIAVPIARGGLYQGAIAHLWGMPTRTIDVAAHKCKVPRSKWVNPIEPSDFDGKHVLLFDKDAVSGATVRTVVKKLTRYRIASLGIYFTHPVSSMLTRVDGLPSGIKVYDKKKSAPLHNAGDAYIEAHEKLGTIYGRRRLMKQLLIGEAKKFHEQSPELSEAINELAFKQFQLFDELNQNLPGVSTIREQILNRMQILYKSLQGLHSLLEFGAASIDNCIRTIKLTEPLPVDFAQTLINERYKDKGDEAAKKRNVKNTHYPSKPVAAFSAALEAVKDGYDVALIVGPEGFAYEPFFQDLGLPTLAVDIPEFREGAPRIIEVFDELAELRGKRVLVVEDDIRSGATLEKSA